MWHYSYWGYITSSCFIINHTIRELWLGGNPITVEGALLIVKSAVDNTVCQYVGIDDEYENDEIKKMMNILEDRRIREVRDYVV